jgi:hypothetical protein
MEYLPEEVLAAKRLYEAIINDSGWRMVSTIQSFLRRLKGEIDNPTATPGSHTYRKITGLLFQYDLPVSYLNKICSVLGSNTDA